VAGCVIALGGLVLWHLGDDLRYAFSSRTPRDLGDASTLAARGLVALGEAPADNRYVSLRGQPDRVNSLYIEPRGQRARESLFRLRGTTPPIFVRAADTARRLDLKERWTGRLRRLESLPYASSLAGYFSRETHATRALDLLALKSRLSSGGSLRDRAGQEVSLAPSTPMTVEVAFPNEILVRLPREKFPTIADAQHELERAGLVARPGAPPGPDDPSFGVRVTAAPAERNAVAKKLEEAGMPFGPSEERWPAPLEQLRLDRETLVVGSHRAPLVDVRAITWSEPITVGSDAQVLTEGEAPGDFNWVPIVCALLVAFVVFNGWVLARAFR
jgi:hypothetical protein